jgi:hypothetical protein
MRRSLFLFGLLFLHPDVADAVDGVIEINQARVAAGGVTNGDTPGFPVTISQSGSYRLTGPLSSSNKAIPVVAITASWVTLDLGGFTVSHCPAGGLCSLGEANAIDGPNDATDVTVRNGNVYKGAGSCIRLEGPRTRVEHVRATECGVAGVIVGKQSVVDHVITQDTGSSGVVMRERGHLLNSTVADSGSFGVIADLGSLVESTAISGSEGRALSHFSGSSLQPAAYRGCVLQDNGGEEVQIADDDQVFFRSLGSNACGSDGTCP